MATSARAEQPISTDHDRLGDLLRAGAAAARARHWDACVAAYGGALALAETATTAGELGLCEEQTRQLASAYGHLHKALESAPAQPKDEPWKRYQAAIARVLPRVAIVYVTASPSNARIVLDGRPLGRADGRGIAMEPGPHTLAARLDGYEEAIEKRTVSAGDVPNIHLELRPKAAAPVLAAPAPPHDEPGKPSPAWYVPAWSLRGALVTLTYTSAVVALAGWGTTLGLELDRASMGHGLSRDACSPVALGGAGDYVDNLSRPPQCAAIHQRAGERDIAMDVAIGATLGVGAAAALAGIVMSSGRSSPHPAIAPTVSNNGGGLVFLGAW